MFHVTVNTIIYSSADRVEFKSTFGSDRLTLTDGEFVRTFPSHKVVCKEEDVKIYTNRELFEASRGLVYPSDLRYADYARYAMGTLSGIRELTPEPLVYDYTDTVSEFSAFLGLLLGKDYNSKVVNVVWDNRFDYCAIVLNDKKLTKNEYVDLRAVLDSIHAHDGLAHISKVTRAKSVREYAERLGCKAFVTRNVNKGSDVKDVIIDKSLDGFWGNTPLIALDAHVNASVGAHLERRYLSSEDGMYCLFYTSFPVDERTIDEAATELENGDVNAVVKILKDRVVLGPWVGECKELDCSAILKDIL